MNIERRALGPNDVLIDVMYCGVCHSDINQARNEWPNTVPTTYPVIPGHEIIGRERAVGNKVTKFRVDDIGGLGHMDVKLAVAPRADVTVFTTTPGKVADAKSMGARDAVLWNDEKAMSQYMGTFDLMISTVPRAYPMQPFMNLLALDGTLVNVGALEELKGLDGMMIGFGRKSLAGSMIGGIAETQEVIDYWAARNIKADIELIQPNQINKAFARVVKNDIRYRFVIDITEKNT